MMSLYQALGRAGFGFAILEVERVSSLHVHLRDCVDFSEEVRFGLVYIDEELGELLIVLDPTLSVEPDLEARLLTVTVQLLSS